MHIVVKKLYTDPPFSLHDAQVMAMEADGDTLRLATQYGYVRTTEPYGQVDGDVLITGVDWESSYVYIMEYTGVPCGNCGSRDAMNCSASREAVPFPMAISST